MTSPDREGYDRVTLYRSPSGVLYTGQNASDTPEEYVPLTALETVEREARDRAIRDVVEALRSDDAHLALFESVSDDPLDRIAGSHKVRRMTQELLARFIESRFGSSPETPADTSSEDDPLAGLPPDLAAVLRDQSVVVPQDGAVFALIAEWANAKSDTASALPSSPEKPFEAIGPAPEYDDGTNQGEAPSGGELRERVAEAMYRTHLKANSADWSYVRGETRSRYLGFADAALAAMESGK